MGAATRGDTTYVAVVLRAHTQSRQATADLLNWAFNQKHPQVTRTVAFEDLSTPSPVASVGGAGGATGEPREEAGESQAAGIAIPNNVGLALGLPVAIFAVVGGVLMYRSRRKRSRTGYWKPEDQEGSST